MSQDVLEYQRGSKTILSLNFSAYEFDCKCGVCENTLISIKTVNILQMIRSEVGGPLKINSGYRCEKHNSSRAVGGVRGSQHVLGKAADVSCATKTPSELFAITERILEWNYPQSGGLRLYSDWIHVDSREKKHRWKYSSVL